MRNVLLSILIIFTLFITSCSVGVGDTITQHNSEIDNTILDPIKILDDKVLESIKNNKPDEILEISSEDFKKNSGNIKEFIGSINESTKDKTFDYKDRYYCRVDKIGKYSFSVETSPNDSFYVNLEAVSKDIFVSLIKSNSNSNDYLLSLVYIKEQNIWKLQSINVGEYSYDGMNAADLYEKAKLLDGKEYKVPAALYSVLSSKLLHPAPFLQYKNESEITNYNKKLLESLKNDYTFPQDLKYANNIKIYGFDVRDVKEGIVPVIKYTTNIKLSNKEAIEKEANDINNAVTIQYPGMKENFKFFLYEAFSEPPVDSKITYNCYRTKVEQK